MNNTFLKNLATFQFRTMIYNTAIFDEVLTEIQSGNGTIAKVIAREIQPMINEYKKSNTFKKFFLLLKYIVLDNKRAKCTIPDEALESFARVILPDIYAFFETEEGQREYEAWLKEEEAKDEPNYSYEMAN